MWEQQDVMQYEGAQNPFPPTERCANEAIFPNALPRPFSSQRTVFHAACCTSHPLKIVFLLSMRVPCEAERPATQGKQYIAAHVNIFIRKNSQISFILV